MKTNDDSFNFEAKFEYGKISFYFLLFNVLGSWMIETTPDRPFQTVNNIGQLV